MLEQPPQQQIALNEDPDATLREKDHELANCQHLKTGLKGTVQRIDEDSGGLTSSHEDDKQRSSEDLVAMASCQELVDDPQVNRLKVEVAQETSRKEVCARLIDAERNVQTDLVEYIDEAMQTMLDMRKEFENVKAGFAANKKMARPVQPCEQHEVEEDQAHAHMRVEVERCYGTLAEFCRTTVADLSLLVQAAQQANSDQSYEGSDTVQIEDI